MDKITSIWDLEEFKPYQQAFIARRDILLAREAYYDGTAYQQIDIPNSLSHNDALKARYVDMVAARVVGVNARIKGLIDPVATAVDLDVGLVPGGWQLHPDSADLQPIVDALFQDVNFIEEGDLYTQHGASMGMATLLIVDDRPNKRVDIQALHPATVLPIYNTAQRSTSREMIMAIIVERSGEDEDATVITPTDVRLFRNGAPAALYGGKMAYPNELGFVPIVDQPYINVGKPVGKNAFADVLGQLNAINATATQLTDNIRKNADPQWVVMSDDEMPDAPITRSSDKLWKISANGGVEAIVAALDIAGVNDTIDKFYEKMEKNLPQYLLHKLTGINRVAAETIRIQLLPLVIHIERVRRSLDAGVVRALRMAGQAAASMNLPDLAALDTPALKLDPARRIIPVDESVTLDLELKRLQVATQREILTAQQAMSGGEGGGNAQ